MKNHIGKDEHLYYLKKIGEKLYDTRRNRNEKITAVATSIGVSHSVISKIENGRYPGLSMHLLIVLSAYFNIPPREFFPDKDNFLA